MQELKPILTRISDEEYRTILSEAVEAMKQDASDDIYDQIAMKLPLSPWLADDMKRTMGIQGLIEAGFNLSRAVEAYGEEWLRS
jgi:hypothetical protein